MKKYQYITIIAVLFLIQLNSVTAQFNNQSTNNWNTGTSNVDRLNIGTGVSYPSVLFVDGANTFGSNTGNVFSTNGPNATTTNWKMSQNGTEAFRIENASGSSNVILGTTGAGRLDMFTNDTANPRVTISSGGNVGIGINSPNYLLHQDGGTSTATYHQFTNGSTSGTGSGNGLLVGITSADNAEINMQDNKTMKLFTNGTSRIFIDNGTGSGGGYVGMGNSFTSPASRLHLNQGSNTDVWFQETTTSTGNASTDGFRLGVIDGSKNVEIKQQEQADMLFYTTDAGGTSERMRILSGGNMGIGTSSPTSILHTIAAGTKTASYTGNALTNTATSSTNGITKYGLLVESTGSWSGTNSENRAAHINASGGNSNFGLSATAAASTVSSIGVVGTAVDGPTSTMGVHAIGNTYTSCSNNYGVYSEARAYNTVGATTTVCGILADAQGDNAAGGTSANTYGGYFTSSGGTSVNYGVYATGGSACTSSACTDAAGYFNGDIIYHAAFTTSDAFLKDNVAPVSNASSLLGQMNPKTYTFKIQDYPSMHLDAGNQYGLIAEDVEQILPELVHNFSEPEVKDDQGNTVYAEVNFKAINYNQIIPILIAGFKEQQSQINALQTQLDGCCASPRSGSPQSGSIELENLQGLQLLQNDPNPFSESTMIKWNLPDEFQNAVLYFYDNIGNQINSYKVTAKGAGELQIFGSKLSSGIYTYTLVVDGKLVDSKKMLKSK